MKKKKKKRIKIDPEDYEGFAFGPIKIERIGRLVQFSSDWKPGEFEEFISEVKAKRPEHKKAINKKIKEVLKIIEDFDPLELLSTVSARNCFADPEEYGESTHEGRECYVEFAQSLVLGSSKLGIGKHASHEAINRFNDLIAEIFNDIVWYFSSEVTEGKRKKAEEELRFSSISSFLIMRGSSYIEHHLDLVRDLFQSHDAFLKKHFGFTADELIQCIEDIEQQINENMQNFAGPSKLLEELHKMFKDFVDERGAESFSSPEECRKEYLALPEVKRKAEELKTSQDIVKDIPFTIKPTSKAPDKLLKLLSSSFGDNQSFVSFSRSPGWPTNDSVIYENPLIEYKGEYYCFMPQLLFRNIGSILEEWIKNKDKAYFENTYQEKRAEYLEKKALEYFKAIIPEAEIYKNLTYSVVENGQEKGCETDGLILYDENLFIIEAKAGSLSISARRGGLDRMKRDVTEIIGKAYEQALRTKNYIVSEAKPKFEFKDGNEVLVIEDKDKFKNIYLVNVTLESLGYLSCQLNSLQELNLIQGKEWPWSVFINDLRVISELIEFPSEFLHFLQRRIRANDFPQLRSEDELDFLMFYFNQGLYFENGILKGLTMYTPHGYTEDLDRYYDFIAGRVTSGKKPHFKIPKQYKDLIIEIESTSKQRFTRVTTTLLGFDLESQQEILKNLERIKNLTRGDDCDHDFTMYFEKKGLMFVAIAEEKIDYWERIDRHCMLKMYQTEFEEWITITFNVNDSKLANLDFKIYNKKWEHDPVLEKQLKEFKETKLSALKKSGQKIGRNDPCPCNSGKKYKRCCGK